MLVDHAFRITNPRQGVFYLYDGPDDERDFVTASHDRTALVDHAREAGMILERQGFTVAYPDPEPEPLPGYAVRVARDGVIEVRRGGPLSRGGALAQACDMAGWKDGIGDRLLQREELEALRRGLEGTPS
jgi:hypothetical protein